MRYLHACVFLSLIVFSTIVISDAHATTNGFLLFTIFHFENPFTHVEFLIILLIFIMTGVSWKVLKKWRQG